MLASASTELICHDRLESTILRSYKPKSESSIKSISCAKDGDWICIVPSNGVPEIISFAQQTPKVLKRLNDIQDATCATFPARTRSYVAVGTSSGVMSVYHFKCSSVNRDYPRADSAIFKVEYSVNDDYFVAGTAKGELNVYIEKSALKSGTFKVPKSNTLMNFRCHPLKRNIIGGCSEEGIVNIWDNNISKSLWFSKVHVAPVTDIAFSPIRSDFMISIGMDRRIVSIDHLNNTLVSEFKTEHIPSVLDICPDGSKFAVGFHNGSIIMYDIRNTKQKFAKYKGHSSKITQIEFVGKAEGNLSEISLPEEKNEISQKSLSSTDIIIEDIPNNVSDQVSAHLQDDSFLDAIGLNTNSLSSLSITDGVKKLMDSKPDLLDSPVQDRCPVKIVPEVESIKPIFKPLIRSQNASSTPTLPSSFQSQFPYFSPISTPENLNLKREIRDLILAMDQKMKAMDGKMDTLKSDLQAEFFETKRVVRTNTLDLQMFLVKESINTEDQFNKLWNVVGMDEYVKDVLEENAKLKSENERLKRELEIRKY